MPMNNKYLYSFRKQNVCIKSSIKVAFLDVSSMQIFLECEKYFFEIRCYDVTMLFSFDSDNSDTRITSFNVHLMLLEHSNIIVGFIFLTLRQVGGCVLIPVKVFDMVECR